MTRVKICGITNLEDALHAIECGADALGFIFVEDSPRYVGDREEALRVASKLPPFVNRVQVVRAVSSADSRLAGGYDTYQFYEDSARGSVAGKRFIRALRLRDETILEELDDAAFDVDAVLLDSYHPDILGGTGTAASWDLAAEAVRRLTKPAILAGGLTPDNVQEALNTVRPYAVDVSSGVEAEPGRKDPHKVRQFLAAVREYDERHGDGSDRSPI